MSAKAAFWEREGCTWPNHAMSRFVDAAGIRWHVQQAGQGPTLLFIHGTGASTHSWRDLLPALAVDFRVLAVDLPGQGFTEPVSRARYSPEGMGEALAALLTTLQARPAFGIGHSAGAALLCRMALDRRLSPRRIISLNGAFFPLGGAAGRLFSPMAKLIAASPWVARVIAARVGEPGAVARLIAGTGSQLDAAGLDLYARLVREPSHVAGALGMMGRWDLQTFEYELQRLDVPVTLLVGANDRAVPPAQAARISRRLRGAAVHVLPALGHLAHEEAPAQVLPLLRRAFETA